MRNLRQHIRVLTLQLTLAAALVFSSAISGFAQDSDSEPKILIIKMEKLLNDSSAARSVTQQIETMRIQLRDEVRKRDQRLKEVESELTAQKNTMDEATFSQRVRDFEGQVREARRLAQMQGANLQKARFQAMEQLRAEITPILQSVMEEKAAHVMLDESQVILSVRSLDVTEDVIARLDDKAPKIDVVLPEQAE